MNNVAPMIDHFRDGTGMPYADLPEDIPIGIGRLWAGVHHMQMPLWFLAMPELRARLAGGGAIADVGCGRGRSSVELARVFPGCTVLGIDNDPASIGAARDLAAARGVTDRVVFAEADAEVLDRPGEFDLIYAFCTIHDMGSPAAALARLRRSLKPDGLLVWVETTASDDPMENRWGPGRLFATVSPLYNLPAAIANGGEGLGTFLSVEHARRLATDAGFATFDELPTESAFISVFLLRP
jgi:ubiquinone/menaquinone biosynthesis C-methylase UbiE